MAFINRGSYFSRTQKKDTRSSKTLSLTVMHIAEALMQRSCIFYDLRKIAVRNFEALAVGSNAHKAKWIKNACRV